MNRIIDSIRIKFNEYHFILLWTILNIIQIATTELTSDEGYYWFYSSKLEWGYYDHPPLLALLIKMGRAFFSGETGVRLFNVLLMSVGLFFLFKIIQWNKRERFFIYLIILSLPLFNYITFIAFPDSPLVAFSIICLYSYKRLKEKNDLI
jgi:4-amino-4-deoxy-L-arabinose transferase-like glycosyltransferase